MHCGGNSLNVQDLHVKRRWRLHRKKLGPALSKIDKRVSVRERREMLDCEAENIDTQRRESAARRRHIWIL